MAEKDTGGQQRAARRQNEAEEVVEEHAADSDVQERREKLNEDVDAILDIVDSKCSRSRPLRWWPAR